MPADAAWGLVAVAIVLAVCVAKAQNLLNDPDTQWHITVGRWIVEHGRLPDADWISHTFEGRPWIAKEWLSQILMSLSYDAAGWHGPVLLAMAAFSVSLWLVTADVARRVGPTFGLLFGAVLFATLAGTLLARPHVLVFPLIVLWILALRARSEIGAGPPWLALPLLVVWCNMHAAFTMGLLIAAGLGAEAVLRANPGQRFAVALAWALFGAACLAAVVATPYGIGPLMLNFHFVGGNEAVPFISEWQPTCLSPATALPLLFVALTLVAVARDAGRDWPRLLLLMVLAYAMLKHARFAMIIAFAAPLLGGTQLVALLRDIGRRLNLFQTFGGLPAGRYTGRMAAGAIVLCIVALFSRSLTPPIAVAPYAALAAVPVELRQQRVFNSYNLGGFLAHQGVKTFIDGRTDQLFIGGFTAGMIAATSASTPDAFSALLDRYGVSWAFVQADKGEAGQFARMSAWRSTYDDGVTQVFVRRP